MSIKDTIESMETNIGDIHSHIFDVSTLAPYNSYKNIARINSRLQSFPLYVGSPSLIWRPTGNNFFFMSTSEKHNNKNAACKFADSCASKYYTSTLDLYVWFSSSDWTTPVTFGKDMFRTVYLDFDNISISAPDYLLGASSSAGGFYSLDHVRIKNLKTIGNYCLAYASVGTRTYSTHFYIENVESIGNYFMYNAAPRGSVTIDDALVSVGNDFCSGCSTMTAINLPQSMTSVGNNFCSGCTTIKTIRVPNNLSTIGTYFCHNCDALTTVYIPDNTPPPSDSVYSLSSDSASASAYVNGIKLTGPGALRWKAALPDRTVTPYRKLLVDNPTVSEVAEAVRSGKASTLFPVGTIVSDTLDSQDAPLIITQYLTGSESAHQYGGEKGALLTRQYPLEEPQVFSFNETLDYGESNLNESLNTLHLDRCSEELKSVLSEITTSQNTTSSGGQQFFTTSKVFLPGDGELMASSAAGADGTASPYWKEKTGLSTAASTANTGRIIKNKNGVARDVWTRSFATDSGVVKGLRIIKTDGSLSQNTEPVSPVASHYVLPVYFIKEEDGS